VLNEKHLKTSLNVLTSNAKLTLSWQQPTCLSTIGVCSMSEKEDSHYRVEQESKKTMAVNLEDNILDVG